MLIIEPVPERSQRQHVGIIVRRNLPMILLQRHVARSSGPERPGLAGGETAVSTARVIEMIDLLAEW